MNDILYVKTTDGVLLRFEDPSVVRLWLELGKIGRNDRFLGSDQHWRPIEEYLATLEAPAEPTPEPPKAPEPPKDRSRAERPTDPFQAPEWKSPRAGAIEPQPAPQPAPRPAPEPIPQPVPQPAPEPIPQPVLQRREPKDTEPFRSPPGTRAPQTQVEPEPKATGPMPSVDWAPRVERHTPAPLRGDSPSWAVDDAPRAAGEVWGAGDPEEEYRRSARTRRIGIVLAAAAVVLCAVAVIVIMKSQGGPAGGSASAVPEPRGPVAAVGSTTPAPEPSRPAAEPANVVPPPAPAVEKVPEPVAAPRAEAAPVAKPSAAPVARPSREPVEPPLAKPAREVAAKPEPVPVRTRDTFEIPSPGPARTPPAERVSAAEKPAPAEKGKGGDASVPDTFEGHMSAGNKTMVAGNHEGAIAQFQAAARLSPGRVEPLSRIGDCEMARGRLDAAVEGYKAALKIRDYGPALIGAARAHARRGDEGDAKSYYSHYLEVNPSGSQADEARRFLGQ